ncbi:MAG: hypothetical protein WCJ56_07190, partial [bacterium]
TPTEALNYYVYVVARIHGTTSQVVSAEVNYPISVATLTGLTLNIGPKVGNNVTLTATKVGTAPNVEYYFYGYKKVGASWVSFTIRTYNGQTDAQGGNVATWTVAEAGPHKVVVLARVIGSTSAYQVASSILNVAY